MSRATVNTSVAREPSSLVARISMLRGERFTFDEIKNDVMIAYPNTRPMCSANCDGAAAAVVVGGTSAETTLKTVKQASTHDLDGLPGGRRDLEAVAPGGVRA